MEKTDDITECCICTEMFADPSLLPCIHTFCLKCLETTRLKSEKNPGDRMPCPICRQQFTIPPEGLSHLQKNVFMEKLVEKENIISKPLEKAVSCDVCLINKDDGDCEVPDASKYCVECRENMCENCSVQHKRQKFSRSHRILALGNHLADELVETFVASSCDQHSKEELKMYCADCEGVICIMCFAESHQLHKCSDVNKVAGAFREEIGVFLANAVEWSKETLAQELRLEQDKRKFMEELEIAETAIKERANELKQLIDKHARLLLDELVQKKTMRIKETESRHEDMKRHLAIVNSFTEYCSEMKSKGTPTDICLSVHHLRSKANELREVNASQMKKCVNAGRVLFRTHAMEDILKVENIVGSLEVSVDFIDRLQCPIDVQAVKKLDNKIYVLSSKIKQLFGGGTMICIFEDTKPFQVYRNIHLREVLDFQDVVSSDKFKCLYISDWQKRCIWKFNADDCRLTEWLPIVSGPFSLSLSNDGHLLLLRDDEGMSQLKIYGSDAKVIRSVPLSRDIMNPLHSIQESNGQFIIIHESKDSWGGCWIISKLNSDGQILRQFQSKEKFEKSELTNPFHLSLDSGDDRLFVTQRNELNLNVVMFDRGSLERKQILLKSKVPLRFSRLQLHYDERKKQLLVGKLREVVVYQLR